MSDRGERGPVGDHGQIGPIGLTGLKGDPGVAPWVVRKATTAYAILALGIIVAIGFSGYTSRQANKHIAAIQVTNCEAGNERSRIQRDDLVESQRMLQTIDLVNLLGVEPDQVDELKRISLAQSQRRIAAIPFVDCKTGKRINP